MGLFFQIIGVLLVLFVLFILVAIWVIRSKLRGLAEALQSGGASNAPQCIHLERCDNPAWNNGGKVQSTLEPLKRLGFVPVGNFEVKETPGLQLVALTHPAHQAYAVVYEHPVAGVWADIYSRYAEGQPLKGCTYSNMHHPGSNQVDVQPNRKSVKVPNLEIDALFQRFIHERPAYELEPVQPERFVELFESAYADEMEWRKSRGGTTAGEIRRVAAASGRQIDDDTVAEVQRRLNAHEDTAQS